MVESCLGPGDVDNSLLGSLHLFQRLQGQAEISKVQRLPATKQQLIQERKNRLSSVTAV